MHYVFVQCRKAVIAGVGTLLTGYAAAWNNDHIVDQTEWVNILIGIVIAVAATWRVPNGNKKSDNNGSQS